MGKRVMIIKLYLRHDVNYTMTLKAVHELMSVRTQLAQVIGTIVASSNSGGFFRFASCATFATTVSVATLRHFNQVGHCEISQQSTNALQSITVQSINQTKHKNNGQVQKSFIHKFKLNSKLKFASRHF